MHILPTYIQVVIEIIAKFYFILRMHIKFLIK